MEGTRKRVILDHVQQCIDHRTFGKSMDDPPFCTGPRRAVALTMLEIIQDINKTGLELQDGKASFSKTPAERGRASVAGSVKKIVMHHRPNLVGELDTDYNQGCAWLGDLQVAGMGGFVGSPGGDPCWRGLD